MIALLGLGLAGCWYGDGEGLYLSETWFESRAQCDEDRCPLAAGTEVTLTVEHYISDTVMGGAVQSATVDKPELVEVMSAADTVVLRGLAPGRTVLRLEEPGYKAPAVLERVVEVVTPAKQYIGSRYGREAEAPDGRIRLLAGSRHTLVLERRDGDGAPLLGDNSAPWELSPGATAQLAREGVTGLLQTIVAGGPETVTITAGDVAVPIDVVPVEAVASLHVYVRERPQLSARDGQTIHMPEAASYGFVIEAFDTDGNVIEGAGRELDVEISGATKWVGSPLGRGFTNSPARDTTVMIRIGTATMTMKLDYP